jgi:hypothetical protein
VTEDLPTSRLNKRERVKLSWEAGSLLPVSRNATKDGRLSRKSRDMNNLAFSSPFVGLSSIRVPLHLLPVQ